MHFASARYRPRVVEVESPPPSARTHHARRPLRTPIPRQQIMDDALVRRLSLPQFFLRQARVALQRPGPYSGGMATSLLQDCVEAFLRILSEHGRVDVGVSASFDKLVHNIGDRFASTLEHRALLTRMNKARVAFKHHGILVPSEDALYFSQGVETFLSEVCVWKF